MIWQRQGDLFAEFSFLVLFFSVFSVALSFCSGVTNIFRFFSIAPNIFSKYTRHKSS